MLLHHRYYISVSINWKIRDRELEPTDAFKSPLRVRELPSDSVDCEDVGAVGIPVDFLSRVTECVNEASKSSKRTMHRVGRCPINCVRVLSLILQEPIINANVGKEYHTYPFALKLRAYISSPSSPAKA